MQSLQSVHGPELRDESYSNTNSSNSSSPLVRRKKTDFKDTASARWHPYCSVEITTLKRNRSTECPSDYRKDHS
jgi:hypothetical protein